MDLFWRLLEWYRHVRENSAALLAGGIILIILGFTWGWWLKKKSHGIVTAIFAIAALGGIGFSVYLIASVLIQGGVLTANHAEDCIPGIIGGGFVSGMLMPGKKERNNLLLLDLHNYIRGSSRGPAK